MILIKRICFLIILIIIYIFIIKIKDKDVFSEKINLNLNNEIGIVIYNNNISFILEINNNKNRLILFSYDKTFNKIENVFNLNQIDELVAYSPYLKAKKYYNLNEINLNDFYIKDNLHVLKIYNYNFCIVNDDNLDINNCTFIYFNYVPTNLEFNDSNKVIFYSNSVNDDFKEKVYTKWLDIYELNSLNYTILKIKKDNYSIINIPV